MEAKNLKLIAKTEEDLRVVSAHLQDAIVNVSDVANLKKNKIFLMQLNRFMWEDVEKGVFRKNKSRTFRYVKETWLRRLPIKSGFPFNLSTY